MSGEGEGEGAGGRQGTAGVVSQPVSSAVAHLLVVERALLLYLKLFHHVRGSVPEGGRIPRHGARCGQVPSACYKVGLRQGNPP